MYMYIYEKCLICFIVHCPLLAAYPIAAAPGTFPPKRVCHRAVLDFMQPRNCDSDKYMIGP